VAIGSIRGRKEADDPDALCRAICSVLEDESLRASLAARGPARARSQFDADSMGRGYEQLYEELCGERSSS
jgi:glycosyltransferase involved in cell wall biosynthesis